MERRGGRNHCHLIAFKISNKLEQRLSPPNLSFLVFLPQSSLLGNCRGRGCGSSRPYCTSPWRPQSCGQTPETQKLWATTGDPKVVGNHGIASPPRPGCAKPARPHLALPLAARWKILGPRYSQIPRSLRDSLDGPWGSSAGVTVWPSRCHCPVPSLPPRWPWRHQEEPSPLHHRWNQSVASAAGLRQAEVV